VKTRVLPFLKIMSKNFCIFTFFAKNMKIFLSIIRKQFSRITKISKTNFVATLLQADGSVLNLDLFTAQDAMTHPVKTVNIFASVHSISKILLGKCSFIHCFNVSTKDNI
jgi:hypothetical protein